MRLPGALKRRQDSQHSGPTGGNNGSPNEPTFQPSGGSGKSTVMTVRQFQGVISSAVVLISQIDNYCCCYRHYRTPARHLLYPTSPHETQEP
jgi:hypothetical protein